MIATLPPITIDALRSAIGSTYFDLSDEVDSFVLDTRENGDVGDGTHGEADLREGRRILGLIRERFPAGDYQSSVEVCDEWVIVSIQKEPRSPKERETMKKEMMVKTLREVFRRAVHSVIPEKFHGKVAVHVECNRFSIAASDGVKLRLTGFYGKNVNTRYPRDYMASDFSECRDMIVKAFDIFDSDAFGIGKWYEEAPEMREVSFGRGPIQHREGEVIFHSSVPFSVLEKKLAEN